VPKVLYFTNPPSEVEKGWKLGRNFPESIMAGRKFSVIEMCFDITVYERLNVVE
jgi:hypothetical protein